MRAPPAREDDEHDEEQEHEGKGEEVEGAGRGSRRATDDHDLVNVIKNC
jgi:hypothetical protein